ncbi:MAG: hypothetical protein GX208_09000 [Firmicutes bacterium]|nr:hypothetical protein [Bacillota bacterium]
MYALFIVLNQTDFLDEILANFLEAGVKGATILDSQGMASAIMNNENRNIPIFGSLNQFFESARPYNKTIFTVLESEEEVEKAAQIVKDTLGDATKAGAGLMFSVPIGNVYPLGERE